MRAPAGLASVNRIQFNLVFPGSPKRAKVVIVISEGGEFFTQLAGTHVTVVVDYHRRFAGRTRERPGDRLLEVCMLRAIVGRDCSNVGDVLHETLARIVVGKHSLAVTFGQLRDEGIDPRQYGCRNLLDLISNQRVASDDVEVLAVQAKTGPHEVRQLLDLGVILSTYHGVDVEP